MQTIIIGNMSYTGTKVRDSLNTIGMLGRTALHVEVAEAIIPQCGSSGRRKGNGEAVYASNIGSYLRWVRVQKGKYVEAVAAGLQESNSCRNV
jgi:hypothetical protein